jgi:hypothetical protein
MDDRARSPSIVPTARSRAVGRIVHAIISESLTHRAEPTCWPSLRPCRWMATFAMRYRDFGVLPKGLGRFVVPGTLGVPTIRWSTSGWPTCHRETAAEPRLCGCPWHGAQTPSPYAELRRTLLEKSEQVRSTIMDRATQTNEVGRLATCCRSWPDRARDRTAEPHRGRSECWPVPVSRPVRLCVAADRCPQRCGGAHLERRGDRTPAGSGPAPRDRLARGSGPESPRHGRRRRHGVVDQLVWPEHGRPPRPAARSHHRGPTGTDVHRPWRPLRPRSRPCWQRPGDTGRPWSSTVP